MSSLSGLSAAASAVSLTAAVMLAPSATAVTSHAPAGQACFFTQAGYSGDSTCFTPSTQGTGCEDFWPSQSGFNGFGYHLTLSSGDCGQGGQTQVLHAGEQLARFPFVVRSISHCRAC